MGTPFPSPIITNFSDAVAGSSITFGVAPNLTGGTFSYAGSGLTAPVLSLTGSPDGGAGQALRVVSNPGLTTDPANSFFGFGLYFNSCTDASKYGGVRFTITGNLGNCGISYATTFSEEVSPKDDARGACGAASCYPPSAPVTTTGTITVPFTAATGGSPGTIDPTSIVGIQWQMNTPLGVACNADFTIDDITFTPPVTPPAPLCTGFPPPTGNITPGLVVGQYTFSAPGLTAPAISSILASDGTMRGLQVGATPGVPSDPTKAWTGFGLVLPGCVDASAYTGVQFTVAGDLGTCALSLGVVPDEQNQVAFGGACTDPNCVPPFSGSVGVGTTTVRFSDLGFNSPPGPVDASRLMDVQWILTAPSDGVSAPCNASFSITDVSFVKAAPPPPPSRTGCAATPTAPVAPGGYYVNGNTICTPDGRAHLFHGVDRMSLEFNPAGQNLSRADFALMGSWNANVVRIALNQDYWLAGSPLADPSYPDTVATAVAWAEMAGMDVILDLHWSDQGVLGSCISTPTSTCQQLMPDANSVTFWSEVAARFKNDGRVMFELYNEPHDVSWDVWRNGGDTGAGWKAVGMQQLYDTVRGTGAQNLVLIGGLNWAYDLSGVPANRIKGTNIVYATHPYGTPDGFTRPPSDWNRAWGSLTATDPVVVTEFGVLDDNSCGTQYQQQVIAYADAHFAGWSAWVWFAGDCSTGFITLITDWAGTPSPEGAIVKAALLGYNDPPASPPLPPGTGPDLAYTFNHGVEGWELNNFDSPTQVNLAVHPPAGGTAPTLMLNAADGNPDPGALQVVVGFTAFDQYVDANVNLAQPGINLAGKVLHARIKLVSGSFPQGAFQFHASTGASYIWGSTFFNASALSLGQWVTVDLDLGAVTSLGYDPAHVVQIGLQFLSGFSSGGGTFVPTGDAVLEIDTVTD